MAESTAVISHWHHSVENFNTSTMDFYKSVEEALIAKEAPNVSVSRSVYSESGLLSSKREYLRVTHGRLAFDICAAPFGKDYFFSWWLATRTPSFGAMLGCAVIIGVPLVFLGFIMSFGFFQGILFATVALVLGWVGAKAGFKDGWADIEDSLAAIPYLGVLYQKFVRPVTYYSVDTRMMFEETVHRLVIETVNGLLTIQKMAPLSATDSVPTTRGNKK